MRQNQNAIAANSKLFMLELLLKNYFNNNGENNNYIIVETNIKDKDINKEMWVINSYENWQMKIHSKEFFY